MPQQFRMLVFTELFVLSWSRSLHSLSPTHIVHSEWSQQGIMVLPLMLKVMMAWYSLVSNPHKSHDYYCACLILWNKISLLLLDFSLQLSQNFLSSFLLNCVLDRSCGFLVVLEGSRVNCSYVHFTSIVLSKSTNHGALYCNDLFLTLQKCKMKWQQFSVVLDQQIRHIPEIFLIKELRIIDRSSGQSITSGICTKWKSTIILQISYKMCTKCQYSNANTRR